MQTDNCLGRDSNVLERSPMRQSVGFPKSALSSTHGILCTTQGRFCFVRMQYSRKRSSPVNPYAFLPLCWNCCTRKGISSPRASIIFALEISLKHDKASSLYLESPEFFGTRMNITTTFNDILFHFIPPPSSMF